MSEQDATPLRQLAQLTWSMMDKMAVILDPALGHLRSASSSTTICYDAACPPQWLTKMKTGSYKSLLLTEFMLVR